MFTHAGLGDDLNTLYQTVENAQRSEKPVVSVMCISPLFGAAGGKYDFFLERLIFIRKECQILHKNITFVIIDMVSTQFIHIKSGDVTKMPINETSIDPILFKIYAMLHSYIDQNKYLIFFKEFYSESPIKHMMYDIDTVNHELHYGYIELVTEHIKKENFLSYDIQMETRLDNDIVLVFQRTTKIPEKRTIVEWPEPNYNQCKEWEDLTLKLSFRKSMPDYDFLPTTSNESWNFIPYNRYVLTRDRVFDIIGSSKYVIAAEGGMCHLARMYGTPYVMIIPRTAEVTCIKQINKIPRLFEHWIQRYDPQNLRNQKLSCFMFEKDLTKKKFPQIIKLADIFFETIQPNGIVFFTNDSTDIYTRLFVKNFCRAFNYKNGKDVQICTPTILGNV